MSSQCKLISVSTVVQMVILSQSVRWYVALSWARFAFQICVCCEKRSSLFCYHSFPHRIQFSSLDSSLKNTIAFYRVSQTTLSQHLEKIRGSFLQMTNTFIFEFSLILLSEFFVTSLLLSCTKNMLVALPKLLLKI